MNKVWQLGFAVLLLPGVCLGEVVYSKAATISGFWSWAQTETSVDGDAVLHIDTGLTQCPNGVYIKDTENSSKAYSAALSAYVANKTVRVQVYDDQYWAGSSTPYCKVRAVFLE
ncbi:hypothetical protein ACSVIJ_07820 [Pseudomonas sp. NCHU5208]|uniref:hypothetical protein n=1 Tax=unclassified Pseudomonas TaxID=196821 RepID=UPI003F9A4F8F